MPRFRVSTEECKRLNSFNMDYNNNPYWTESLWFSWGIPERNIHGYFWAHFRPNMNLLNAGPAMWDPSGKHVWEFLYYDFQLMRPMPEGRYGIDYNKFDFETPWGMYTHTIDPLRKYKFGYQRNEFTLDLVFECTAEPYLMSGGTNTNAELKRGAKMHFEQPGRITGMVKLDGEHFDVDCFGIRDGGHGARHLEETPPGAYTWSTADDKTSWQTMVLNTDRTRDSQVLAGYLLREGQMAPLVRGVRRVVERTGPQPNVLEVKAEDSLGRQLHAIGRAKAPAKAAFFPERAQWWSMFKWEYDGFTDAVGEDQEFYSLHDFRRWHRGGPDAWKTR